ncbi:transglutaminase domain-containing protein [Candidatus Woesearchaeota archaeon]|nr:transglutaminase domain-containing protein [Candidatus Woesearchaeota archaeon]
MKRFMLSLAFLILLTMGIPSLHAANADFTESDQLLLHVSIGSDIQITPTADSFQLKDVSADLFFYPRRFSYQKPSNIITVPVANITEQYVHYYWENPDASVLSYRYDADVEIQHTADHMQRKIFFPLPRNTMQEYVKPRQYITSDDPAIGGLASSLVEGENDLSFAVDKIAVWAIDNINYNLTTLTAPVTQNASWVFENRYGVCDEITSLFIAMVRSVGIPARFVSGLAYTNYKSMNDWGPHAWAEVYFPDVGWVPYDLTYHQLGYVDPTHIVLRYSTDAGEPSVQLHWLSEGVSLHGEQLSLKVKLLQAAGKRASPLTMTAKVVAPEMGFGSYNLLQATIKNPHGWYVTREIQMQESTHLNVVGKKERILSLGPYQEKNISWIISADPNLDTDYVYTLYAEINGAGSQEVAVNVSASGPLYSLAEMRDLQREQEDRKTAKSVIFAQCLPDKREIYLREKVRINCTLTNTGTTLISGLDVCLEEVCSQVDVGTGESKTLVFEREGTAVGKQDYGVSLRNARVSRQLFTTVRILDVPSIAITQLKAPETVTFGQPFTLDFLLDKTSESTPVNVSVAVMQEGKNSHWNIGTLDQDKPFSIAFDGYTLDFGENTLKVTVRYLDTRGRVYETSTTQVVRLSKTGFKETIMVWLYKAERALEGVLTSIKGTSKD